MRNMFIKNTQYPARITPNYISQEIWGSAESSPNGVRGGTLEALALTAYTIFMLKHNK